MGRKTKKVAMTRGLGTRYGATLRKRYIKVLTEVRRPHKCPQCSTAAVKRESVGVWNCKKCGVTFTGGAYTPVTKLGVVAKRQVKSLSSSDS
ncbi:50S ribosomal protein L37ae [Candidatus Bathyarchaeota archaeon]|nr:50S ribosomal protein L37ae [Candidatus Bathyarchaeota archaeon]